MNYELAKQLEDSGFPYDPANIIYEADESTWPTLSELIAACGDELLALQHTPFNPTTPIPIDSMPRTWMALGGQNRGTHFSYQQSGFTAEQAVANLWLALHPTSTSDAQKLN